MRLPAAVALSMLLAQTAGATVIDRVTVIVGRRAIKTSDIDRELRVSAFLNRRTLDESPAAMRKAAERLIDQELVRQDVLSGQYAQPTPKDAADFLHQLQRDRFGNSEQRLTAELARYHLTPQQLQQHLLWQLTVLRFIDERFRAGVLVTDEEVAAYYREHQAALEQANPRNHTLEALSAQIRETLTGERINQAFEEWLAESRKGVRIDYRPQAFPGGTP